jgi:membrane-associated phospholipid phosphatase
VKQAAWLLGVGAVLVAAFLVLGALVSGPPGWLDTSVAHALGGGWDAAPGRVAYGIDLVLGPALPFAFSALLVGLMVINWRRGRPATVWLLTRCFALMWLCRTLSGLKLVYRRERPRPYPDYSYPSGHVVSVTCVAVAAVVLSAWLLPNLVRWVVAVSAVLVLVTMVSRVVLDVHWCTDVLGAAIGVVGVGLLGGVGLRLLPVRKDAGVASIP